MRTAYRYEKEPIVYMGQSEENTVSKPVSVLVSTISVAIMIGIPYYMGYQYGIKK